MESYALSTPRTRVQHPENTIFFEEKVLVDSQSCLVKLLPVGTESG